MRLRLANMRVIERPRELMPVRMVIGLLQENVNVAHEGVINPGAFSADFIERHVIPHLQRLQQLEAIQ